MEQVRQQQAKREEERRQEEIKRREREQEAYARAKKAREEGYKKRANEEGRGRPGVKAGAASDAPVKPDDAPQALSRFYK